MKERNLPIKLIMQRGSDSKKNRSGGSLKFFCDVTPELKTGIIRGFEGIKEYYADVFRENALVPAVGKIVVRPEAIAKSHKPNDLCRKCPIIGSEDLGEIYIKVTSKSIDETIGLVANPPSRNIQANMTAVLSVDPVVAEEKITNQLYDCCKKTRCQFKPIIISISSATNPIALK